jgi:hypothetical protein
MFTETETAETGMPHVEVTVKSRTALGWRAGPPRGSFAFRVSTTRHGASV